MWVALDTDVIQSASPWFNAVDTDELLIYLQRSGGRLLISDVVWRELQQHVRDDFAERLKNIDNALKSDRLRRVVGLTDWEPPADAIEQLAAEWDATVRNQIGSLLVRVPADNDLLPVVLERAIEKRLPFGEGAKGFKDTLIWLSILRYASAHLPGQAVGFVSQNKRDFASKDGTRLHEEYAKDTNERGVDIRYYTSLKEFIRGNPFGERRQWQWPEDRVQRPDFLGLIQQYFQSMGRYAPLTAISKLPSFQIPYGVLHLLSFSANLVRVQEESVSRNRASLFLDFDVLGEADVATEDVRLLQQTLLAGELPVRGGVFRFQLDGSVSVAVDVEGNSIKVKKIGDWQPSEGAVFED